MSLASNIRSLRVAGRMTVDDLHAVTHVPAAVIRSMENGVVIGSVGEVQAIARYFETTEDVLRGS